METVELIGYEWRIFAGGFPGDNSLYACVQLVTEEYMVYCKTEKITGINENYEWCEYKTTPILRSEIEKIDALVNTWILNY